MGTKTNKTSPPSGNSTVAGLGESFNLNLNTGQGVYSHKISLPEGVAGFGPKLTLEYSSSNGVSNFGWGWDIGIRSINRKLDFGVPEEGKLERFMDNGNEIVPTEDGTFRAQIENAFSKYTKQNDGWKIEDRDGNKHFLGKNANNRISQPGKPNRIFQWLLERSIDPSGNEINYKHFIDEGTPYISQIEYAIYRIKFIYINRTDVRLNAKRGFLSKREKICQKIKLVLIENGLEIPLKTWSLRHTIDKHSEISILSGIKIKGHGNAADGSEDINLPETTYNYTSFNPEKSNTDIIRNQNGGNPPPLTDTNAALINLENAPLPGILQITNGKQYYWRNDGEGNWFGPVPQGKTPFVNSFEGDRTVFADMNGSGWADMMMTGSNPLKGFYENKGSKGWGNFIYYPRNQRTAPSLVETTRFSDISGNGTIDAIQSTNRAFTVWSNKDKNGWSNPILSPKKAEGLRDVSFDDAHVHLADMTGDGLQDIVKIGSGRIDYWPNTGNGTFGERITMRNSPKLTKLNNYIDQVFLFDVSGDGCDDLVVLNNQGLEFYINKNGESFSDKFNNRLVPRANTGTIRIVDFNGEGKTGLLYNSWYNNDYVYITIGDKSPSNLLSNIDNGYGLVSEIEYSPAVRNYLEDKKIRNQWETDFPFSLTVVSRTCETDINTNQSTEATFKYHNAHYDYSLRQFQGFGKVEKLEHGDNSRPTKLSVHDYLMAQEKIPGNKPIHSSLNGKLSKVEVFGLDGSAKEDSPYMIEESEYKIKELPDAIDGRERVYLQVHKHRTIYQERSKDERVEEKVYTYDDWGNITKEEHIGSGKINNTPVQQKILNTSFEYAINTNNWILDRRSIVVVRNNSGNIVSESRQYYDGPDYVGLASGNVDRGLLTREEKVVWDKTKFDAHYTGIDTNALGYFTGTNNNSEQVILINYKRSKYDSRGLRIGEMDAVGKEVKIKFTSNGLFKSEYISAIGNSIYEYDKRSGIASKITNPDGSIVRFEYDGLGRITNIFTPDNISNFPSRSYEYDGTSLPNKRITKFYNSENLNDFSRVVTYFDGKVKEMQNRIQTGNNEFTVTEFNIKNPYGDNCIELEPFYSASENFSIPDINTHNHQKFFYDVMGRIVETNNYNDGISTAEYKPFEVITSDPNDTDNSQENIDAGIHNTPKAEEFDVFRNRTKTSHFLENGAVSKLSYVIDDLGQLVEIHDDHGKLAMYLHDLLGNRLEVNHREAGIRTVWFNAIKTPVKGTDSNGNVISSEYDPMGRISKLSANGSIIEEYTYDTLSQGAFGKMASVTYNGGKKSISYDKVGHVISKTYEFDDRTEALNISFEYDRIGRRKAIIHNDGTKIQYGLTPNGWVNSIPGIINDVKYDAMGNPLEVVYANGVVTQRSYNKGGRKILTQKTINNIGAKLEDLEYVYNKYGQLKTILDNSGSQVKKTEMAYNAMDQLISFNAELSGGTTQLEYEFGDHLNITKFGDDSSIFEYTDATKPNRITNILNGQGGNEAIQYDSNGNMKNLPGKKFSFDFKNQLTKFEGDNGITADYFYDQSGNRIEKIVDNGIGPKTTTYFIDNTAEYRDSKKTFFVYLGGIRVGLIKDNKTSFIHSNFLGNTSYFSDENGTKIAVIDYRPYGNTITSSGDLSYKTFGTHPYDEESGLFYMRKRYYSPDIGRFITPDPVAVFLPKKVISSTRALHPYNYTGSDPVNNVDLTGLSFWSVFGAIIGVIVAVVLVVFLGPIAAILIGIAVLSISYALASSNANNDFGEFMRGFMIGFNAGLNAAIGTILFGPVVGIALGVINFLAAIDSVAENPVYKGILGWSSWFMPMSWLATGLGLIFFVINLIVAGVTFNQVDAVKIDSISIHWELGMISMEGGAITYPDGGFNMGNFTFVGSGHSGVLDHELGHGLSNAAFGSIFHFIGAIDENAIQENMADAYAEHLADSNDPTETIGEPSLDMWTT